MPPSLQQQTTENSSPLAVYEQCVHEGKLANDEAQKQVIAKLQALYAALSASPKRSLWNRILHN
jgi:predicted ATPase